MGKCQVYGNGHYQTFDSKWFRFDGHCQYTLVEVRAEPLQKRCLCCALKPADNSASLLRITVKMETGRFPSEWKVFRVVKRPSPVPAPSSLTCRCDLTTQAFH